MSLCKCTHRLTPKSCTAMAEEEEEDYMGDLSQFLPSQPSLPPKSSSQKVPKFSKTQIPEPSNKNPKFNNWQEIRKIKREKKQVEEDQQTLANLESAIPQSNIGFKMLKQMGYTPGKALGKEGVGLAEPVGVEIRRGRAGIGREDPRVEKERREMEMATEKRKREEELMVDFGCRVKEQWRSKRVVVNFYKARGVLEQLEGKEVVVEKKEDGEGEDEDEDEDEEEEEEKMVTEEDLEEILMKLRNEFRYCLFCGCQYESMESLQSNCPGINEDDH